MSTRPFEPEVARVEPREPEPPREPVAPLVLLSRRAGFLLVLALAGAVLAFAVNRLRPAVYRATASVLVVEPRLGSGAVDYNLTPIRSYTALLSSRTLADACVPSGSTDPFGPVSVRMPENTRLLEISYEGRDATTAAAFVNCVAQKAIEENARMNAGVTARSAANVGEALKPAQAEVQRLAAELGARRGSALLEVKRGELRTALAEAQAWGDEERRARMKLAEAAARQKSFAETSSGRPRLRRYESYLGAQPADGAARGDGAHSPGTPVVREEADPTRDFAEKEGAAARAEEAAARSALVQATAGRAEAERRAAAREREVARDEQTLDDLKRRLDAAQAAAAELEKRRSFVPVEAAGKAFELVLVSPAPPKGTPTRPRGAVAAGAGALLAAAAGALLVLSRPEET